MENAVDALIMAGSVLLLIIALTVSISSFTSLKTQVEAIVTAREETDLATAVDDEGNTYYLNYIEEADDIRTVDSSTIISSIRRIQRESYTIYICGNDTINKLNSNYDDLKTLLVEAEKAQEYQGMTLISQGDSVIKLELAGSGYKNIDNTVIEELRNLLDEHADGYKEYLGIYQEATAEDVSSANKTTYRIITFVEV